MSAADHPFSAVDVVIIRFFQGSFQLGTVTLDHHDFQGKTCLPGSLVQVDEDLERAARRIFSDIFKDDKDVYFEQIFTFSAINRDPRRRSISTAYLALVPEDFESTTDLSKRHRSFEWRDISHVSGLFFDHDEIVNVAWKRFVGKLGYTTIATKLLPAKFPFRTFQKLYEKALGHEVDRRNFRKKILHLDFIHEVGEQEKGLSARPAALFSASSPEVEEKPLFV